MAVIEPFSGIRYNPAKVGDLNRVVAPPYDIISERLQEDLYRSHPNNVIRLELNREKPQDSEKENRYTRSAAYFKDWFDQGILIREDRPVIYSYFMDYRTSEGEAKTLKGFLCRLRLETFDTGVVLPHENTLSGPKADRLRLMEACHINFSPIFSLYSNPARVIPPILDETSKSEPLIHVTDPDGVRHRVWAIPDPDAIQKIRKVLSDRPIFIADGHHRYETALTYRNAMREKTGSHDGCQGFDYVMTYIANMEEPGLTIYPTHRLVDHLEGFELNRYIEKAGAYFEIQTFPFQRKKDFFQALLTLGGKRPAFGLYTIESDDLFLLCLKNHEKIRPLFRPDLSAALRELDVSILHTVLLNHFLGIGEEALEAQSHVRYVKDREDAIHSINDRDAQMTFLMNPTRVDQLREVSLQREKMPQKSTYFYPKLLTGLVMNSLE